MPIRALELRDIASILTIQLACPEIAQWNARDYERVTKGEMAGWVFEEAGELLGFLVGRQVVAEMEILNFAVRADARRKGIGDKLLQSALAWAAHQELRLMTVVTQARNEGARRLYERCGFVSERAQNYFHKWYD